MNRWTDKKLAEIEKKIRKGYKGLAKDVKQEFERQIENFAKQDKAMKKKVADGTLSQSDYDNWRRNQAYAPWISRTSKDLAKKITNHNKKQSDDTSGEMEEVYTQSRKESTSVLGSAIAVALGYSAYRSYKDSKAQYYTSGQEKSGIGTVSGASGRGKVTVNTSKDVLWNNQRIDTVIRQGIAKGEGVPKIAKNLENVVGMNRVQALRTARTLTNSTENLARYDTFSEAQAMGIPLMKTWIATMDGRTRDSHLDMDGETVPLDEPFSNGLMYPGELAGPPAEVYNCRCALGSEIGNGETSSTNDYLVKYADDIDPESADNVTENFKTAYGQSSPKVQTAMAGTKVDIGTRNTSGYDRANDTLYLTKKASVEEVHHEIGHLVEAKLMDAKEVRLLKEKNFSDTTVWQTYRETYKSSMGVKQEIILFRHEALVDPYQGRIYCEEQVKAFGKDHKLRYDQMKEYVSVGYSEYIKNPQNVRIKDNGLYQIIKRSIE